jgi:hypothetical protein
LDQPEQGQGIEEYVDIVVEGVPRLRRRLVIGPRQHQTGKDHRSSIIPRHIALPGITDNREYYTSMKESTDHKVSVNAQKASHHVIEGLIPPFLGAYSGICRAARVYVSVSMKFLAQVKIYPTEPRMPHHKCMSKTKIC